MLRHAAVAVAAVLFLSALPPVAAGGTATPPLEPVAEANPRLSRDLIDALPPIVRASNVKIDPSVTADTPIVYPDGTLVPGQSAAKGRRAARARCGGPYKFSTGLGTRLITSRSSCAVFGRPGLKMRYTWSKSDAEKPGLNGRGCVGARSYDDVQRGKWFSASCGYTGGRTVYWGNILARPKIQARSSLLTVPFQGAWRHGSVSSSSRCTVETYRMAPSKTRNAGRIKCPTVFTNMRAKVKSGSKNYYGRRVGAGAWSTVVLAPGKTVKNVYAVK